MTEKLPQVVEAVKCVCRDPSTRVSCFGKGLCRRGGKKPLPSGQSLARLYWKGSDLDNHFPAPSCLLEG